MCINVSEEWEEIKYLHCTGHRPSHLSFFLVFLFLFSLLIIYSFPRPPSLLPFDFFILFSNATSFSLLIQPLWRFTDSPIDGRLLVYRSEDIRNLSRLVSPKVCGYIHAEAKDLLPQNARRNWDGQEKMEQDKGELCFSSLTRGGEYCTCVCSYMCLCEEMCRRRMENIMGYRSQIMCSPGSVLLFVDGKEQIV